MRLTDRQIRRGMNLQIVAGALGMIWMGCAIGMPLTMLMESLGAKGVVIGLMVTVQQVAMAVQIPGALFAERLPTRKRFWMILTLIHRGLWFLPPILLLTVGRGDNLQLMVWCMVGIVSLSAIFAQAGTASWWSWMSDLIPDSRSGAFWGRRQSVVMTAFLVTMAFTGWLLDLFPSPEQEGGNYVGFILVFAIGAAFGSADILLHTLVPEPPPEPTPPGIPLLTRLMAPLRDRNFRWLTISMGMWYLSIGIVSAFGVVYLKRQFHVSYTHLAVLNISAAIGTIFAGLLWGYVIDRVGARAFGAIMLVIAPLCAVGWFFVHPVPVQFTIPGYGPVAIPQPILLMSIINLAAGGFYSGVGLAQVSLASSLAPKTGKTMAMAMHWTIIGIMGAAGPLVGGVIMDYFTAPEHLLHWELPAGGMGGFFQILVLLHIGIAWFLAMPILLLVRPPNNELPVGTALNRLMVGNPLRVVSSIYNIYASGAPMSRAVRARAVRALGESRTEIAVDDLIRRLDDPSADVREEAVFALGSIGSQEAVRALVAKLESHDSDLAPQIARALRQMPVDQAMSVQTVDVLVRQLDVPDRETQSESARTLGAIGDPRASAELLDLISQTQDSKVLSATSEALARLGELAAIYQILPRMKETRNPILKRSLAVAIGDLLGEADGFYKVLTKEEQNRCSEVDRLLKDLRSALRKHLPKTMEQETERLEALTHQVLNAYEADEFQAAADALFDLAIGLAAALHGAAYGGHAKAFIFDLVWRDQRFGIGVWYLDLLRERWDEHGLGARDPIDILLGIYFIASQRGELAKRSRDSDRKPDVEGPTGK